MARKQRNDIDYFPHSVNHGKKMFYLRSKYKNDGYAVWFLLLEELGKADNHYLDLKDDVSRMYLSSSFMIEEDLLMEIIQDLVKFKEFDAELWEKESILFNQNFVDSIEDAYKKRVNQCVTKTSLIDDLKVIGRWIEPKKAKKPSNPSRIGDGNPQSIVKDIKVDEIKPEESKELEHSFESFWDLYDKKVSKDKCESKWLKLTENEKQDVIDHIPKYKISQPVKQFRKNPETYLNNKSWNDEIIETDEPRSNVDRNTPRSIANDAPKRYT